MTEPLDARWDRHYAEATPLQGRSATVLNENVHLLPRRGDALDLAAGLAANAFVLARQGLTAQAWDLSSVATRIVQAHAVEADLAVIAEQRDVSCSPPAAEQYDVIVVSSFLDRDLCPLITEALRPGGLLFYQTFCQRRVATGGPSNPDFLLADGELLRLFPELEPVVYREEGELGDPFRGFRDRAMLVARRPSVR
ncbi:MAG: class I SAM-dependent methyltransferase [Ectothiorhodospiraceae bacterium]